MAAFTLTVDGTDLSTLGFTVLDPGGLWDPVSRRVETAHRADDVGSLVLTDVAQAEERPVLLRAAVTASSLAQLDARLDELKWRLRAEEMVLEMSDRARELTCRRQGRANVGRLLEAQARVAREYFVPLVAPDPRWYDKTNTNVGLSTTEADCAIGTAEVEPVLTGLPGGCTIEHRDAASAVLETFAYSGIASTPVTVDFAAKTVTDNAGVEQPAAVTAGSVYFKLGRAASSYDYPASSWPKLRLSTGTGTATYKRAWE